MAKRKDKQGKREVGKIDQTQGAESRKSRRSRNSRLDDSGDLNSQLKELQLCTKDIAGDGNCLFRALSDQYYGSDRKHKEIRQEVCRYMRDHEDDFRFFVEDDRSFEDHIRFMETNGTYGGNMELVAFARLSSINIKVYQPGLIYVISGFDDTDEADSNNEVLTLHIAYHSWEHYSSIRNVFGPHTGLPEIQAVSNVYSNIEESIQDNDLQDSKEKVVQNAFPDVTARQIRRLLRKFKGDHDKVIDHLYDTSKNNFQETFDNQNHPLNESDAACSVSETKQPPLEEQREDELCSYVDQDDSGLDIIQQGNLSIRMSNIKPSDMAGNSSDMTVKSMDSVKPKIQSARERKQLAKTEQKERRLAKKRELAASKLAKRTGNPVPIIDDVGESSMKQLFI
ncbi:hypothetical protein CLU79DRAFT_850150 [Phycomyces nitens]|nr:hypothetical protein CLU79DRAFT_850150 [Phycomyces nitens]